MKMIRISIMMAVIIALFANGHWTPSSAEDKSCETSEKNIVQSAVFKVPDLTKEMAKKLSKALADKPGVLSAKPDLEKQHFTVTFEPEKNNPEKIGGILASVVPGTALQKVVAADQKDEKGCGGCKHKKACSKNQKK